MKPPSSRLDTKTRRVGAGLPALCRVPVRAIVHSHSQPLPLSNTRLSLEALALCIPLWPHRPDSSPRLLSFPASPFSWPLMHGPPRSLHWLGLVPFLSIYLAQVPHAQQPSF